MSPELRGYLWGIAAGTLIGYALHRARCACRPAGELEHLERAELGPQTDPSRHAEQWAVIPHVFTPDAAGWCRWCGGNPRVHEVCHPDRDAYRLAMRVDG